jgi:hypothetical protein
MVFIHYAQIIIESPTFNLKVQELNPMVGPMPSFFQL